jgi:hypothetical protein
MSILPWSAAACKGVSWIPFGNDFNSLIRPGLICKAFSSSNTVKSRLCMDTSWTCEVVDGVDGSAGGVEGAVEGAEGGEDGTNGVDADDVRVAVEVEVADDGGGRCGGSSLPQGVIVTELLN